MKRYMELMAFPVLVWIGSFFNRRFIVHDHKGRILYQETLQNFLFIPFAIFMFIIYAMGAFLILKVLFALVMMPIFP